MRANTLNFSFDYQNLRLFRGLNVKALQGVLSLNMHFFEDLSDYEKQGNSKLWKLDKEIEQEVIRRRASHKILPTLLHFPILPKHTRKKINNSQTFLIIKHEEL